MMRQLGGLAAALTRGGGFGGAAKAECTVGKLGERAVTMDGPRPTIAAKVNGAPITFVVDSGASYSNLSAGSAAQMGLKLGPPPLGMRVIGVGGEERVRVATVAGSRSRTLS